MPFSFCAYITCPIMKRILFKGVGIMKKTYKEVQLMMVKEKIKEQLYCLDNAPNPEVAFEITQRIVQLEDEKEWIENNL